MEKGGRGPLLSAVGFWVRGPSKTFLSGLLGQQSSSDLSLRQLKVDMLLPTTLESNFTNSTVSTSAVKELNSFARSSCQLFTSLSSLSPIKQTCPKRIRLKVKSVCALSANTQGYAY